jgi:hypothetical protein
MYEKPLARAEAAALEDVVPNREHGLGETRCLDHRETFGDGKRLDILSYAPGRIAASIDEGTNAVAHVPAGDTVTYGCHRTRDLETRERRVSSGRRIGPETLLYIRSIDTGGHHLDQNLASPRLGYRHLGRDKNFGAPFAVDLDRGHGGGRAGHGLSSGKSTARLRLMPVADG